MKKTILSAIMAVITGVAIYWLTTGWKPSSPAPESSVLDGRVYDQASMRLLEGVAVSVQLEGNAASQTQTTDSDGRYLIEIPKTPQMGKLLAAAPGYTPWEHYLNKNASGMFESVGDIALRERAKATAPEPAPPPEVRPSAAPKLSPFVLTAKPYERRPLDQALRITVGGGKP